MSQGPSVNATARSSRQVLHLKNKTCIYCGTVLTVESATDEHVIGRRFVPKGTLNGAWNLIAQCCGGCNGKKAALENDISAILLQPNGFGAMVSRDSQLALEAVRKGKTKHRATGKPVSDSRSELSVPLTLGSRIDSRLGFVGPPQIDPERAKWLAWYHVTALNYLTTFDQEMQRGQFSTGAFSVINQTMRPDWGNVVQVGFARATAGWKVQCYIDTASGYFKAVFRRHPSAACRSFALEWSKNLRIVGMLGDGATAESFEEKLPRHTYLMLDAKTRYREEIPLASVGDVLFAWEGEDHGSNVSVHI